MTTNVIWKQELKPGLHTYQMPAYAKILSVGMQRGAPQMWFMCDPSKPKQGRTILFTGTGHEFDGNGLEFIGTMQTDDQNFVFHVLEELSPLQAMAKVLNF